MLIPQFNFICIFMFRNLTVFLSVAVAYYAQGFQYVFLHAADGSRTGGCDKKRGRRAPFPLGGLGACSPRKF